MKRNLLFAAIALMALAGCTSDEYVGENGVLQESSGTSIQFASETPHLTRGTSAEDAAKLEYKFKVFGVKTANGSDQRVFATATSGVKPYDVWYAGASSGNTTASNSSNWEYVGSNGTAYGQTGHTVTLEADQTIKYWDYSADYNFQAWSDVNSSEKITISSIDKNTMSFSASAAQLGNLWISDLITVYSSTNTDKTAINTTGGIVQFKFRKAAAKVRLGIYETIPGYVVKNMKFYWNNGSSSSTERAHLTGSFIGSTTSTATFNVTYSGTPDQKAELATSGGASNTDVFDFGTFNSSTSIGTSSTNPTWATGSADYTWVFPNTTNVGPMTLTVDYTLYNEASGETILVSGATAVVPEAYMTWNPNYAYTYIFKITDNTNGSTGQSVVGLYPITLDAVVVDAVDGSQETITTVSTPSITCYQDGVAISSGFDASKPIVVSVDETSTITVKELVGDFDYGKSYDQQSYNTSTFGELTLGTDVTSATFNSANISDNKTYVIKAVATTGGATAYFVLSTKDAEVGPNP